MNSATRLSLPKDEPEALDSITYRGYNVPIMTTITSKLIKDGNSVAVRLPKPLLVMSGLHDLVRLEAKRGQIILTCSPEAACRMAKENRVGNKS